MDANTPNAADIVRAKTGEVKMHPLNVPLLLNDGTLMESIRVRRPTARDMRGMKLKDGFDLGSIIDLVAGMGGLMPDEADRLDGSDVIALAEVVAPFLEGGPGKSQ